MLMAKLSISTTAMNGRLVGMKPVTVNSRKGTLKLTKKAEVVRTKTIEIVQDFLTNLSSDEVKKLQES